MIRARLDMSYYFKRNHVIALDMVNPNNLIFRRKKSHFMHEKNSNFYLIRFALGEES